MFHEIVGQSHDGFVGTGGAGRTPGAVLFIGSSRPLLALRSLARERGYAIVDEPTSEVLVAVADEDVLDGFCTAVQGRTLAACWSFGITCLPPELARTWMGEQSGTALFAETDAFRVEPHAESVLAPTDS